jgi:uncharacterized membrane protein
MRTKLIVTFEALQASFWFKPSFMALAAVALSFATVALDRTLTAESLRNVDWIFNGGAEGASAVLQTISSSMITIAGVVFSLTLVALSLASSQFGSRLLRNFMRDGTNQLVLGTFIATFLYCLLVLRTIRREDEGAFVPHVSVTLGVVFALASLWMLIYFIHHVSVSIQANEVIGRVGADFDAATQRLFPEASGTHVKALPEPDEIGRAFDGFARDLQTVTARADGYLQLIDLERLTGLAAASGCVFRLERRPGQYIVDASVLVSVTPSGRLSPAQAAQVQDAFVMGNQRSAVQDVEFALLQLVEIAVRALSPGINDPFTAIACVDRLGSALACLARRPMPQPQPYRVDDRGNLRIIGQAAGFADFADAALNQLRQYGRNNVDVTLRLMEMIGAVGFAAHRPADRAALRRHADMIFRGAQAALPENEDRLAMAGRYHAALVSLRTDLADLPDETTKHVSAT